MLLVGAGFGVLGYLLHAGVSALPWFGGHTDAIAVTVIISGLIARFAFGTSGLTGVPTRRVRTARSWLLAATQLSGQPRWAATETAETDADQQSSPETSPPKGWARFAPTERNSWIRYQEGFPHVSMLGLFAGGMSAGIVLA